ncbi:MAG: DsbA family protein [Deltaproteobacteria bacterium]|nr:DsbA family protein [Deltaproteobacteria bacterium]MBI3390641.1 DsbA family protein [Deltaproteobacteria bacterium]
MARKVVRYYFSFGSPFAALADAQIDVLVENVGADLDPIPINAPPSEPPEGFAATLLEYKHSYQYEDAARWARKLGLAWYTSSPPQRPVNAEEASIGYYIAREERAERAYRNGVFRACWAQGRDISDRGVLADCACDAGLARDDFVKRLDHEQYRNSLMERAVGGLGDRVFGVPFFVVDGERFWGNDRIEFLLDALRGRT